MSQLHSPEDRPIGRCFPLMQDLLIEEAPTKLAISEQQKDAQLGIGSPYRRSGVRYPPLDQVTRADASFLSHSETDARAKEVLELVRNALAQQGRELRFSSQHREPVKPTRINEDQQHGIEQENRIMGSNSDSHDWYRDLVDAREDARQHTDKVSAHMRDEMRQDRREIIAAISASEERISTQVREYKDDTATHVNTVSRQVEGLSQRVVESEVTLAGLLGGIRTAIWIFGAVVAIAAVLIAILQYQSG